MDEVKVFYDPEGHTLTVWFGPPEEAVTAIKRRHIIRAAQHYIQHEAPDTADWRIDVVAIELDDRDRKQRLEIIENAVSQDE